MADNVDKLANDTASAVGQSSLLINTPSHPPLVHTVHGERPEKFSVANFKRWQQKMLFYLTTLNLGKFLKETTPALKEGETDRTTVVAVESWRHSDFLCRNYILNRLYNNLYNVYSPFKRANDLWESLEKKYRTEDAGLKKIVVGRFLDFLMVDSKSVMIQVQELQLIMHEIASEGMCINEPFQVAVVIEKLPPAWRDFKNYLKHKRKDMSLEDLIVRLRIEEDNRSNEKKAYRSMDAKANVVEQNPKNKKRKYINEGPKHQQQQQQQGNFKKAKLK